MTGGASSPVIVVSPAIRAGTTLVQRLLCSAPNALIYGDMAGQELEFLARYAAVRAMMLAQHQPSAAPMREAVLAGNVSEFITPLAPRLSNHVAGLRAAGMAWVEACSRDAAEAGRSVWGWKQAGPDPLALKQMIEWLPDARWIFITRSLRNCYRSAKAAGMVAGPSAAADFVSRARAVNAAFAACTGSALRLRFEEMLSDPAGTVSMLESFTGARGVDSGVFARRVNQFGSSDYLPPAELNPAEESVFTAVEPLESEVARAA